MDRARALAMIQTMAEMQESHNRHVHPEWIEQGYAYYRAVWVECAELLDHFGSYSWLWWINGVDRHGVRMFPDAPHDLFGAFGHGGPRAMWVIPSLDVVVIGITEHAATQLGDIVFVELPDVGTTVTKDEEVVVIESVKAASDILAPIDGEIVEVNETLNDSPATVNDDPIGNGWMFKIAPSDPSQMDEYMDEAAYKKLVE